MLLALSGSETVEQADALSRSSAQGLGSDAVVLPEQASPALDAFRAPLSAIGDAERVVVVGDDPVEERAPVVDLWIKAARAERRRDRHGRRRRHRIQTAPGARGRDRAERARRADPRREAARC